MGLLNRLFGTPTPKAPPEKPATRPEKRTPPAPKPAVATAADTATPAAGSSAAEAQPTAAVSAPTAPLTPATPDNSAAPSTVAIDSAAPAAADNAPAAADTRPVDEPAVDVASVCAADEVTDVTDTAGTTAADEAAVTPEMSAAETAAAPAETAQAPAASPADKTATADAAVAAAPAATAEGPEISEHLQRRLDTYFARLRRDFPDGRITRLNTAHKKLAERGAELRRLIGYEGRLDEFFALGGFVYQRGVSGRPTLPAAQTDSVEARLRERFPEDVPTLLAVQQADHRLYLDLRAAARRAGCTVGDYLNQFRAD